MTAELLDQYSGLCDELEGFMSDENTDLRCHGSDGTSWVDRKKAIIGHIDLLLQKMRQEAFSDTLHPGPIRELRDQVMKKLLKLLLLSRENEHLLLKNSLPRRLSPPYPPAHFNAIRNAYQTAE
jgi:hypothetical protein